VLSRKDYHNKQLEIEDQKKEVAQRIVAELFSSENWNAQPIVVS